MFNRIRCSVWWANAVLASSNNDLDLALRNVEKIKNVRKLYYFQLAFEAGLMLRLQRFDEADSLFNEVVELDNENENPNIAYTKLFASYWIEEDPSKMESILDEALSVKCDPAIRRWLPLYKLPYR